MALSYKDDIDEDERLNPAAQLRAAETQDARSSDGSHDHIPGYDRSSDGLDSRESEFNAAGLASAAESLSSPANWVNNAQGKKIKVKGGRLKRYGPAGILSGTVLGIFGSMLSFAPATLLVNLKENFVNTFDQQSVMSSNRSTRILTKRLTGETTSGVCTTKLTILCRYNRPSNYQIKQLDKAGVKALDKNGNVIEKRLWPNKKPAYYDIPGVGKVAPGDLGTVLRDNPIARNAFKRAYNPRYVNWVDDVGKRLFAKLGVSKVISEALSKKAGRAAAQAAVDGSLAVADEVAENKALRNSLSGILDKFARKASTRLVKTGKQDAVLAAVGIGCIATKVPGLVSTTIKAYRLRALAKVAFMFLTVADAIKAGTATPDEVENAGTLLTQVVNGKSAMDGAVLYGILGPSSAASAMTPAAQRFIPGKSALLWDIASKYVDNPVTRGACDLAMSPYAPAAITAFKIAKYAAVAPETLGIGDLVLLVADVGVAAFFSIPGVDDTVADMSASMVSGGLALIPDGTLDATLNLALGDMTEGVSGEDLSSVITNGADESMAQAASMGGGVALTPSQKVAYDNMITRPTQLAWAEEDRATHSPFDASNPNTFLGSIVSKLLPYYGNLRSIGGLASTFFSIASSSFANFLQPSSFAADPESSWQQCTGDVLIAGSSVAADPLCAIQYGIPTEFADLDPSEVAQDLYDSGNIDENGEVKSHSDLEEWMGDCNTGAPESPGSCVVAEDGDAGDRKRIAEFSLYQIDKRIIDGMDNIYSQTGSSDSSFYSTETDLAVY